MVENSVLDTIRGGLEQMFSAERKVAEFVLGRPEVAVMMNVSELANASGVSDATVVRMCKHIGYQGYYQMKINLSHDLGRNILRDKRKEGRPKTAKEVMEMFAYGIVDVAKRLDEETLLACVKMIKESDTVYVIAAGNTVPVAMDLSFRLGRYGVRTASSVIPEYFLNDINHAKPEDLVIAISKSGSSKQVLQGVELARKKGLRCIGITEHKHSPLSQQSDLLLISENDSVVFRDDYGPASHLSEMAINDLLIYFVIHADQFTNQSQEQTDADMTIDQVEYMLSEYKV